MAHAVKVTEYLKSHAFAAEIDGAPVKLTAVTGLYTSRIQLHKPLQVGDTLFSDWFMNQSGSLVGAAREVWIHLRMQDGKHAVTFALKNVEPAAYMVEDLEASSFEPVMEILTVRADRIERIDRAPETAQAPE